MSDASRSRGLEGVVIGGTSISLVEGTEGRLSYRGYKIQDLAANSSYEEVLYLLLYGVLPTKSQLDQLDRTLRSRRDLPDQAMTVLRALPTTKTAEPIDVLRTVVSSLALLDSDVNNTSRDAVIDKTLTLAARMPTILAAVDRLRNGK
jgi:citrate synthase